MDMLGDAEPVELTGEAWDDDTEYVEVRERPSAPRVTPEGLAVTSLTMSVASLLIPLLTEFVISLAGLFTNGEQERTKQFVVLLGPTGLMALAGIGSGLAVWRRRAGTDRWTGALAVAGLSLGALVAVFVAAAAVVAATTDPSQNFN